MRPRRWSFKRSPLDARSTREGVFFVGGQQIRPLIWLVSSFLCSSLVLADESPTPSLERSRELVRMVRQDCGSCHGLTLRGGLGPALLPEALRDKSPAGLKYTILFGRPGTAMPPWQPFLSEAEADWIVAQLLRGFPEESK